MKGSPTRAFLAYVITTVFTTALFGLFFKEVPVENKDLVTYMLGQLSGFLGAIVAFDFGSNRGSEHKTNLMYTRDKEVTINQPADNPIPVQEMHDELPIREGLEEESSRRPSEPRQDS